MPFHVALLWALFWISGLGPVLVMLYIPIGVAWIIGYGIYLGIKRLALSRPDRKGEL
jgi:hypothetical protein